MDCMHKHLYHDICTLGQCMDRQYKKHARSACETQLAGQLAFTNFTFDLVDFYKPIFMSAKHHKRR